MYTFWTKWVSTKWVNIGEKRQPFPSLSKFNDSLIVHRASALLSRVQQLSWEVTSLRATLENQRCENKNLRMSAASMELRLTALEKLHVSAPPGQGDWTGQRRCKGDSDEDAGSDGICSYSTGKLRLLYSRTKGGREPHTTISRVEHCAKER